MTVSTSSSGSLRSLRSLWNLRSLRSLRSLRMHLQSHDKMTLGAHEADCFMAITKGHESLPASSTFSRASWQFWRFGASALLWLTRALIFAHLSALCCGHGHKRVIPCSTSTKLITVSIMFDLSTFVPNPLLHSPCL